MADPNIIITSDQTGEGWRGEAYVICGPIKRLLMVDDGHAQPYEAEATIASRINNALIWLITMAEESIAIEADEAEAARLAALEEDEEAEIEYEEVDA